MRDDQRAQKLTFTSVAFGSILLKNSAAQVNGITPGL
jgi:hypothetical protein